VNDVPEAIGAERLPAPGTDPGVHLLGDVLELATAALAHDRSVHHTAVPGSSENQMPVRSVNTTNLRLIARPQGVVAEPVRTFPDLEQRRPVGVLVPAEGSELHIVHATSLSRASGVPGPPSRDGITGRSRARPRTNAASSSASSHERTDPVRRDDEDLARPRGIGTRRGMPVVGRTLPHRQQHWHRFGPGWTAGCRADELPVHARRSHGQPGAGAAATQVAPSSCLTTF